MVAGPAYAERIQQLPSKFVVTLRADPGNRFNPASVVVLADGETVGYLPPEIARHYFESLKGTSGIPCPGRRASLWAHDDTGVDILLDLTGVPCAP